MSAHSSKPEASKKEKPEKNILEPSLNDDTVITVKEIKDAPVRGTPDDDFNPFANVGSLYLKLDFPKIKVPKPLDDDKPCLWCNMPGHAQEDCKVPIPMPEVP
ncbi:hypothetical protein M408DRAFT_29961 [Serendipita vermifera MAFF 305830]|uniref:Uncharacterized protein n=1 Tax=Serendipita vermifera MAFF 305830 TaxID=933852 RepID=A0A0C2W337_SERVB|nr:hypothetical protein M408DRAFT_29961 [Serendipita vermifera MAFF 305830]